MHLKLVKFNTGGGGGAGGNAQSGAGDKFPWFWCRSYSICTIIDTL